MNKSESPHSNDQDENNTKSKQKGRAKKRKRPASESSSDDEMVLPENTLEVEKNLHASAIKNNLDDVSVKKILKKVVTNDHVLALVKLREEEEDSSTEESLRPKLTRAKAKELMKVSPKSAPWNLELTPIKHIPVKTRPEVKALIAQELPEDEDDEEYEPTPDDVPSDDDHTLESSDIDSLPRTPATPRSQKKATPRVVNDGPFKVPQLELSTAARRKLDLEEEATIALRTRSKLSLSSTSIEHIESSFVPPDDLPMPDVDSLWNDFLNDCLNPVSNSRHEEDDDADPEYNVAADPDAQEEDEEALENSIIKISKKELNDLVTELFSIMPDGTTDQLAETIVQDVFTEHTQTEQTNLWVAKREPVSDEETNTQANGSSSLLLQARESTIRLSVGKSEPQDDEEPTGEMVIDEERMVIDDNPKENVPVVTCENTIQGKPPVVQASEKDCSAQPNIVSKESAENPYPLILQKLAIKQPEKVQVEIPKNAVVLPEQRALLEQHLRQHVQLAASSFLQLFVHPVQWKKASTYKEFLVSLNKMADENPSSVVNVCNLKPAVDLIAGWEESVAQPTPENLEMVKFLQKEVDRYRQRVDKHGLYIGEFPEMMMKVVANSSVFLYPYLLPAMPFRPDLTNRRFSYLQSEDDRMLILESPEVLMKVVANSSVFLYPYLLPAMPFRPDLTNRRFSYLQSEDEYITLGLAQFWSVEYVSANPALFPTAAPAGRQRRGLAATVRLVTRHMLPWMTPKSLMAHISVCRKNAGKENPIVKFFETQEVNPVKHKLLQFNPHITLYEHPEVEIPRVWMRYLAKTSKRFKRHYYKRSIDLSGKPPEGVDIDCALINGVPKKVALSDDFTKEITCNRKDKVDKPPATGNDVSVNVLTAVNIFTVVNTGMGSFLVPLHVPQTVTVNTNTTPICTPAEGIVGNTEKNVPSTETTDEINTHETSNTTDNIDDSQINTDDHCTCCVMLRKMKKQKQKTLFDYFKPKQKRKCECVERQYPLITNRLRLLLNYYKTNAQITHTELEEKIKSLRKEIESGRDEHPGVISDDDEETDVATALSFYLKLAYRCHIVRKYNAKKRVHTLFSKFLPPYDVGKMTSVLGQILEEEMVDLYKEFIGFLTPDQADSIGNFKDYFMQRCLHKLTARIEESVSDKQKRCDLFKYLSDKFNSNAFHKWSACEICTDLLDRLREWPELAKYVFSLFPHRRKESSKSDGEQPELLKENGLQDKTLVGNEADPLSPTQEPESLLEDRMFGDETLVSNEADHSSNEGDDENDNDEEKAESEEEIVDYKIKSEEIELGELNISIRRTADSEASNMSALVMSDDDPLKTEEPDWRREDDKVILEILKQHISPQERRDKTIAEMVEESPISMIADSLPHKSVDEVTERIFYLLQLLATSER